MKINKITKRGISIILLGVTLMHQPAFSIKEYTELESIDDVYGSMDYLKKLTEEEFNLLLKIIKGVCNHEEVIELSEDGLANVNAYNTFRQTVYSSLVITTKWDGIRIKPVYEYKNKEENIKILNNIDTFIHNLLNEVIEPDMNDLDKLIMVYRYIGTHFKYNYKYLEEYLHIIDGREEYEYTSIEDAIETKKAVCHTFSYMLSYCCKELGIEYYNLYGHVDNIAHMWGLVKINNHYYHIDPTLEITTNKGKGLSNLLKTDYKRELDGVSFGNKVIDKEKIICDDRTFDFLEGCYDFEYLGDHIYILKYKNKKLYFNTETLEYSEGKDKVYGKTK